jgi:hypothetical protein
MEIQSENKKKTWQEPEIQSLLILSGPTSAMVEATGGTGS